MHTMRRCENAVISVPIIITQKAFQAQSPSDRTYLEGRFGLHLASSEVKEFGAGGAQVYILYPHFYLCHAQACLGAALPGLGSRFLWNDATPPPPPPRAAPVEANLHTTLSHSSTTVPPPRAAPVEANLHTTLSHSSTTSCTS